MDWEALRKSYPITHDKIYFMTASVGGMHRDVMEASKKWIEMGGIQGGIDEELFLNEVVEHRQVLANHLKVSSHDVALTESTSHNMNILAMMLKQKGGGNIISFEDEFPSSVLPFYHHGLEVKLIPSQQGFIGLDTILKAIDSQTRAVVISHVQFSTGFRSDLAALGEKLEEMGVPFIVNATQSIGAFAQEVQKWKASALSASCHKWLGGGLGQSLLYLKPEFRQNYQYPLVGWGSVEDPFAMKNEPPKIREDVGALQLGVVPFNLLASVTQAIKLADTIGIENISKRILDLGNLVEEKLKQLPINLLSYRQDIQSNTGILVFEPQKKTAQELADELKSKKIYVNQRRGKIRISTHFYNNEEEIETFYQECKKSLD
jgi:cysteine desulfurase / selenocysteine lyase